MIKQIALLSILLTLMVQLSAQTIEQKADSLQLLIEKATEDTLKAKYYHSLGSLYIYSEPPKAISILQKARFLSERASDDNRSAKIYYSLFAAHDMAATPADSMLVYIRLLEKIAKKTENVNQQIKVHWSYAIYYSDLGQNDKDIEENLKALELVRANNLSKRLEARLLGNIGSTFDDNEDYSDALKYYREALPIIDEEGKGYLSFNIGLIYARDESKVDSALILFTESVDIFKKFENHNMIASTFIEQGSCYDMKGLYERANQYYADATKIVEKYNLPDTYISLYMAYAQHYKARKQYVKSIKYSGEAIQMSKEQKNYRVLKELLEIQDTSYFAIGNYKKAYEVRKELMGHLDSLNNLELQGKVKELQTEYEVEQKELENELLKSKNEASQKTINNRSITALALLLGLLLLGSWAFVVYRSNQRKQKYNEELEATVAVRTNELKVANTNLETANKNLEQANYELKTFNYIASHDIKEPIRNIGNYAGLIYRRLPDELKKDHEFYFNTIKNSSSQLYTLVEDFSKYTQFSQDDNIEMQPVRLNEMVDNLNFALDGMIRKQKGEIINKGLPIIQSSSSLIYTILKNLIENGLKYNKSKVPTVTVSSTETEQFHQIHIKDNGIGIAKEYHEQIFEMFKRLHNRSEYEGSGIGLAIVKLLSDKLKVTVQLESELGQGSTFTLSVPK